MVTLIKTASKIDLQNSIVFYIYHLFPTETIAAKFMIVNCEIYVYTSCMLHLSNVLKELTYAPLCPIADKKLMTYIKKLKLQQSCDQLAASLSSASVVIVLIMSTSFYNGGSKRFVGSRLTPSRHASLYETSVCNA